MSHRIGKKLFSIFSKLFLLTRLAVLLLLYEVCSLAGRGRQAVGPLLREGVGKMFKK